MHYIRVTFFFLALFKTSLSRHERTSHLNANFAPSNRLQRIRRRRALEDADRSVFVSIVFQSNAFFNNRRRSKRRRFHFVEAKTARSVLTPRRNDIARSVYSPRVKRHRFTRKRRRERDESGDVRCGGFELLTRAVRDDGVGASWERERWVELRDVERYVGKAPSRERERERERLRPRRFLRERREHFRSF